MPKHSEIRQTPYSPAQLTAMVADVARYPEFLPWCCGARILHRAEDHFVAELEIGFSHLRERYSSKVVVVEPSDTAPEGRIDVTLIKGPFRHLSNHWRFVPTAQGAEIQFFVEFEFQSALLGRMMGGMFGKAVEKMTSAFLARADQLYGPSAQ